MGFSNETLDRLFQPIVERHNWETASEYGEPGYGSRERLVVLGDYWCRCGTPDKLHTQEEHHPLAWQAWIDSGVELEWHDEWMVDYDTSKAYRTKADSYSWQPSVIRDWEYDYWLTPDSPISEWIEWAKNDPERCLLSNLHDASDLEEVGFIEWAPDRDGAWSSGPYETGWHAGQNDDPRKVYDEIVERCDYPVEVVFCITEQSQFYTGWSAYYRKEE